MSRKTEEGKLTPAAAMAGSPPFSSIDTRAVSDFISRYDELSKKRLEDMNQKLRELEVQMDTLEFEMKKAAGEFSMFDSCPDSRILFEPPPPFVSP